MNCQEFATLIDDFTGDRLMDAAKQAKGLAHTQTCARCAARLSRDRALTTTLKMVAGAEREETPAHIKAALLKTFSEKMTGATMIPAPLSRPAKRLILPMWKWAAAAAILLLAIIAGLQRLSLQSPMPATPAVSNSQPSNFGSLAGQPIVAASKDDEKKSAAMLHRAEPIARHHRIHHTPANESGNSPVIAKTQEQVTDYMPLTYMNGSTAIDSGVVVRVQMPRATLASMGLPVNADKTGNLVTADLVIGDDGVTRAIRLVHDSPNAVQVSKQTRF